MPEALGSEVAGRKTADGGAAPPAGAESPSRFRSLQHTLPARAIIRGFILSTRLLPVWFLRLAAVPFVGFFISFTWSNFRAVMKNMKRIRPRISWAGAALMAFGVYRNYSYYLVDLFHISHSLKRLVCYRLRVLGGENLLGAREGGRGLVLLTTHLGNWEVGGLALSGAGLEINVVYSPDSSGILERQRRRARDEKGINEIPLGRGEFSSIRLLRLLESGGIVAMQGDRLLFDRGVSVGFFGSPAAFPQGPAKLAMLSGCPVVPVFMPMTGYKSYDIIIERPMEMEGTMEENLRRVAGVFERYISEHPTQWYAFSPFWDEDRR